MKAPEFKSNTFSLRDIYDLIETVEVVPTYTPTKFLNQFKIYKSAGVKRFYIYDNLNAEWSYITLT